MRSDVDRTHHLAVFNIGRPTAPLDSAQLQGFMDGLDPINALAERAPGFVWRYTAEGTNNATAARPFNDDVIVNFGVWESRERLWDFVYRSDHLDFLRRRREWFQHLAEPFLVLWWVPAGHIPTLAEALDRLDHLRRAGPGPAAFTFRQPFDPPVARSPFAEPWIDGTRADEPQTQTQPFDRDTYVIRQSLHTNFEGNFLYLLFGDDRALLLDTGAGGLRIRPAVDAAIAHWLAAHARTSIPLVVAHSHSHADHRRGDLEFQHRPDTTVVGLEPADVADVFGITRWPHTVARFDLGGRGLDIIPTPGHQAAHIMLFDERTGLLLSGDTLYPGRLYIPRNCFAEFRDSIDRVVNFTQDRHVSHILGCHIEMTREAGVDYAREAAVHPNERALELPYTALLELRSSLHGMCDTAVRDVHRDFVILPLP